jgi:hypothetical protein
MDETGIVAVFGLISLIGLGLLAVWVVRWATRGADGDELDDWSRAHGLAVTPTSRPVVLRYLSRVKRLRRLGALAGLVTPAGFGTLMSVYIFANLGIWINGYSELWTFGPFWILAGYVGGIVVAELSFARRVGDGERRASLVPRELPSYLPGGMVVALRSVALAGTALLPVYVMAPRTEFGSLIPGKALFAVTALGGLAAAGAVEATVRWIVRRPQPVTAPDLVAADDAIRASSAHALAGAGIGLVLLIQAAQWAALSSTDVPLLRAASPAMVLACLAGVVASCLFYGHRAWRVERPDGATVQP